eukprot:gene16645-19777_t
MSGDTKSSKAFFESEIKKQQEPPAGQKERVWTPHSDSDYHRQTVVKASGKAGTPPPKKSLADLP